MGSLALTSIFKILGAIGALSGLISALSVYFQERNKPKSAKNVVVTITMEDGRQITMEEDNNEIAEDLMGKMRIDRRK